jgi:sulfite reductase beta subunit-like hemoprotein
VPLGDLAAESLVALAALAPEGEVFLSREQNVVLRSVPIGVVDHVLERVAELGLGPDDARGQPDVRACPGITFCSLALTDSQEVATAVAAALADRPEGASGLSIAVSGCPNSCVKQQVADIGLVGTKFRLDGRTELGYQLLLGADLGEHRFAEPVLKLLEREVPAAVTAVFEIWSSMRRPGEPMARTFRRMGLARVGEALAFRLRAHPERLVSGPTGER